MIKVSSPSNIAIVKYWGKYGRQLPRNASVSFTLTNAVSQTTMKYQTRQGSATKLAFLLDGLDKPGFAQKIEKFFKGIEDYMPFLQDFDFEFESHNTFPHSSGIASSASGMSAVAMCICQMELELGLAEKLDKFENINIENRFNYSEIKSISTEARQKLEKVNPKTIGQAKRISGVSPSDINVLLVLLGR